MARTPLLRMLRHLAAEHREVERLGITPSGPIHFAGEHCSQDFQGFMEGGASEGVRAAKEIMALLK